MRTALKTNSNRKGRGYLLPIILFVFLMNGLLLSEAGAFTLNVVNNATGAPISGGFRWLLEEDNTHQAQPGNINGAHVRDNSPMLNIHNSHAPVVTKGSTAAASAVVNVPNTGRYFVSVLPNAGYALGGAPVAVSQGTVTVYVNPFPIPTSQISVYTFLDQNPVNNGWDEHDTPFGRCKITIKDDLGEVSQDAFGNPIGTTYMQNPNGTFQFNPDGTPAVMMMGSGNVYTLTQAQFNAGGTQNPYNLKVGEALIKFIVPGKYGITITPPTVDDSGQPMTFVQTTTIEGTPTIDAWVKANEPQLFVEGFGTGFKHVAFGFVKTSPLTPSPNQGQNLNTLPWNVTPPPYPTGGLYTGSITGTVRYNHFNRPPNNQGYHVGPVVAEGWVALNDPLAQPGIGQPAGLIFTQCDANGNFTLTNIPPGTYNLVTWDRPLDSLFGFNSVTVPPGGDGRGGAVSLGNVLVLRWFGTLEGSVFYDTNQNGFRDAGEAGIPNQAVNLRFRDGTIYQAQATDGMGEYEFGEVFPFFKWLVTEVDFARYKATGLTTAIDYGGPVMAGWPGNGNKNPQPQVGGGLFRTEVGPVLTQAMHLFLNQTNLIDWGKAAYNPMMEENGGISGIVYYATTRAENDPRYAAADPWEPGIPRVTVNLYQDFNQDGVPDGAAIDSVTTDSWDDSKPSGCIQDLPVIHGVPINECADGYGTWNQVRPGIFDGGYAFGPDLPTGTYIVEVIVPPGYELVKEEDKNVDFGDEYTPSLLKYPPPCVGALRTVPAELTLFPGIAAPFAGQQLPLCDRKQVVVNTGANTAADFFLFTEVPKAARAVGFVNNDLGAEFNMASPNFGEKLAASWIPISFKDWTGREITRVYSDEFGGYNALLPSTFTVNAPTPTGVSPNMITLVLNDPIRADGTQDPFYNPVYSVTPWTFNYMPGKTSYLDTPLVPMAAFASGGGTIDTEPANGTPVIRAVNGPDGGGPLLCSARTTGRTLTITALGSTVILNPNYNPSNPTTPFRITRDYGFGLSIGQVTLNGTALTVTSWSNTSITVTVPTSLNTTGQLMVRRGDNSLWTEIGLTLHIVNCAATTVRRVAPGTGAPIQTAIDAATAGDLILVAPGNYNENVIMNKAVRLQGTGTGSTFISGNPTPVDRLQAWHDRMNAMGGTAFAAYLLKNPFTESEAPTVFVSGQIAFPNGTNIVPLPGTRLFNPGNPFPTTHGQALVDGFTLSASKAGGGLFALAGANHLIVSNNNVTGNQGNYAGGIAIGTQDAGFDSKNTNVIIRYNKIHKNGGVQGGGGISMNEYANNYLVQENLIAGNFSRFNGAGINHRGVSPGENIIRWNRILFNEDFFGALLARAGDGGGIIISGDVAGGTGSGNVTIDGNLIQGNMTGSGYGGGIRAFAVNGTDDVLGQPEANWNRLRIFNNIIVNNVAAMAGAGISLQDVARGVIINNTIASNDTTATSQLAFTAGQPNSNPQPAGIHSGVHSDILRGLLPGGDPTYSKPVLVNNIIWQNRSWFYDSALPPPPGGVPGGLAPRPAGQYWDLGVEMNAGFLDPSFCILTDSTGFGAGSSNLTSNPSFVSHYFNSLATAVIIDEGGNNINVRYTPLIPNSGNYHIGSGSPAVNSGTNAYLGAYPSLAQDFDRQTRPSGTTSDRGADETTGGGGGATYSISGFVRTSAGAGISAVTMALRLGTTVFRTATTNSLGSYQFTGIPNGTYTVTPTRTGYVFTPTSRTVVVSGANRFGINYTGATIAGAQVLRSSKKAPAGAVRSRGQKP